MRMKKELSIPRGRCVWMARPAWAALWLCLCQAERAAQAEPIIVQVTDEIAATVGPHFHAVHYDGPRHKSWDGVNKKLVLLPGAFGSPFCRRALKGVGISVARIFVDVPKRHPEPGVFDWSLLDEQVAQVLASETALMLCLHQRGPGWFVGDKEKPWWQHPAAREEWRIFAEACARRYRGKVHYYEVLNEPEHLHKEKPGYMGWDCTVAMFVEAASAIKAVEPGVLCGGAATWAAWESAEWGKKVLAEPGGERLLDFVSYHIYTSHSLEDSDDKIMAKTPWFEDAPAYVRGELKKVSKKRILTALTEFNTSAVCSKDGKPYTDPRNVDPFGGVVAALAQLHSARGGCDIAVHFGTMGGFGLIRWPPEYKRQSAYYAVQLLNQVAGLAPGAHVLKTTSSEQPKTVRSCVRGESQTYDLESFAIKGPEGTAIVLVSKRPKIHFDVSVSLASLPPSTRADLFQYSATRLPDSRYPIQTLSAQDGAFRVTCPPYSMTVLKCSTPTAE